MGDLSSLFAGLQSIGSISSVLQGASTSFLIAASLVFILFVVGMTVGKSRIIIAIVSVYVAIVLKDIFPFREQLADSAYSLPDYALDLGLLVLAYIAAFFCLNKSMSRTRITLAEVSISSIIILSIIQAGLIVSTLVSILPESILNSVGPSLRYFSTPVMRFVWTTLPLVSFLMFLKPRRYFRN